MTVKALRFFTTLASVGVLGATLVYTPVSQAFNFGDMMNPGKWMGGGNRDRYYDDDYGSYGGPYGGPWGGGGPYGGGPWGGGPYGYGGGPWGGGYGPYGGLPRYAAPAAPAAPCSGPPAEVVRFVVLILVERQRRPDRGAETADRPAGGTATVREAGPAAERLGQQLQPAVSGLDHGLRPPQVGFGLRVFKRLEFGAGLPASGKILIRAQTLSSPPADLQDPVLGRGLAFSGAGIGPRGAGLSGTPRSTARHTPGQHREVARGWPPWAENPLTF